MVMTKKGNSFIAIPGNIWTIFFFTGICFMSLDRINILEVIVRLGITYFTLLGVKGDEASSQKGSGAPLV